MLTEYKGFLRAKPGKWFNVLPGRVAPESLLATECLVQQIIKISGYASGTLLDLGCSTKPYKPILEKYVDRYYGIDVPFTSHTKGFIDVFALGEHLPFRAGAFNTIFCTEVLEHVPSPAETLLEMSRVLAPEGIAIVSTPFCYRIHEAPWDYFRYTPYSIKYLADSAGLELIEIHPRGGYPTVLCDIILKGMGMVFGALRRMLSIPVDSGAYTAYVFLHRLIMTTIQKLLWVVLKNDSLASDRFTLGYAFVLKKPGALPLTKT